MHGNRVPRARLFAAATILALSALTCAAIAHVEAWGPSQGPRPGPVVALTIDPTNPLIVYAGTRTVWEDGRVRSPGALHRSPDGGRRWIKALDEDGLSVAVSPSHPSTVYVGTRYYGVFKSVDGGRTLRRAGSGLPKLASVTALAIDRSQTRIIYAGLDGYDGLFRTTDGGRHWHPRGLADYTVDAFAIDPRTPTSLYAAIWDPQFGNDPENRLARSTNGGRTWDVPTWYGPDDDGLKSIWSFAITLLGPQANYAGTARGVFKSTDGGGHWTRMGLKGVTALVIHPRRPRTLYAGTSENGVFKSTNGGRSWSRFNRGLTDLDVHVLALDSTGRILYAGTDAGVYQHRNPG